MDKQTRRSFLKSTTGAAIGLGAFRRLAAGESPNETIRMGVVGIRGRGRSHIEAFGQLKNVEVAAICDVDENVIKERKESHGQWMRNPVKVYYDVRELLQDNEIDAVSIATPNHWHSLMGIWACQAGSGQG